MYRVYRTSLILELTGMANKSHLIKGLAVAMMKVEVGKIRHPRCTAQSVLTHTTSPVQLGMAWSTVLYITVL